MPVVMFGGIALAAVIVLAAITKNAGPLPAISAAGAAARQSQGAGGRANTGAETIGRGLGYASTLMSPSGYTTPPDAFFLPPPPPTGDVGPIPSPAPSPAPGGSFAAPETPDSPWGGSGLMPVGGGALPPAQDIIPTDPIPPSLGG